MKSEKGQSLVEFALILPVFILLVLGIADFGRAFHIYLTIDHAGREAARAASIGKSNADVKQIAYDQGASIDLKNKGIVTPSPEPRTTGSEVTITITYPFTFITPVIEPVITWTSGKQSITLTDTTVMRVE